MSLDSVHGYILVADVAAVNVVMAVLHLSVYQASFAKNLLTTHTNTESTSSADGSCDAQSSYTIWSTISSNWQQINFPSMVSLPDNISSTLGYTVKSTSPIGCLSLAWSPATISYDVNWLHFNHQFPIVGQLTNLSHLNHRFFPPWLPPLISWSLHCQSNS